MGHDPITQSGHILPGSFSNRWNDGVQARFITETAISRFTEVDAPSNMLYQAYLWNAFTYRTMGEWWCDAVLGPTDPDDTTPGSYEQGSTGNFNRAIDSFTAALGFASTPEETHAARGGRGSRARLAGGLERGRIRRRHDPGRLRLLDQLRRRTAAILQHHLRGQRAPAGGILLHHLHLRRGLLHGDGRPQDPLVRGTPPFPTPPRSLDTYGQVEWKNQAKYNSRNDDQRIVSGWEMRLLEAEAALNAGNWQAAMTIINPVCVRETSATPPASRSIPGSR